MPCGSPTVKPRRDGRRRRRRRGREPEWERTWSTATDEEGYEHERRVDEQDEATTDFDRLSLLSPASVSRYYSPRSSRSRSRSPLPDEHHPMRHGQNHYSYYNPSLTTTSDGMIPEIKGAPGSPAGSDRGAALVPYSGGGVEADGGVSLTYAPPPVLPQPVPPQLDSRWAGHYHHLEVGGVPPPQQSYVRYNSNATSSAQEQTTVGAYPPQQQQHPNPYPPQHAPPQRGTGYHGGSPPISPADSGVVVDDDDDATTQAADNTTVLGGDGGVTTVLEDAPTTTTYYRTGGNDGCMAITPAGDGATFASPAASPVGSPLASPAGSTVGSPTAAPTAVAAVPTGGGEEEPAGLIDWMKNLLACEANKICFAADGKGGAGATHRAQGRDRQEDRDVRLSPSSAADSDRRRVRGRLTDDHGNVYEGQLLEGRRDGIGSIHYAATGDRYDGAWKDDKPHGEGRLVKGDGTHAFDGRWNEGMLHLVKSGVASVIDQEGNQYDGSFENWKKHGLGTLAMRNGEKYVGSWANGVRHGFGTLVYPDGSRFEGIFNNDQPTEEGQTFDPESDDDDDESKKQRVGAGTTATPPPPSVPMQLVPLPTDASNAAAQGGQQHISPRSGQLIHAPVRHSTGTGFVAGGAAAVSSMELQRMVLTDDFTPSKQKSKSEKKAAKKIMKEMKKLEKMQQAQEHFKKKQIEALLKAEVKQKRLLAAQMKREQKKIDERQRLQAKALMQAKEEQQKNFAEMTKMQEKEMKAKLREIERMQRESSKKVGLEKRRAEKELNEERARLQKFEETQREELERRQGELEVAQRKFVAQQQKALAEQRAREQALNMRQYDSMKYKAEAKRVESKRKQKLQKEAFEARTKEISRNWQLQSEQEQKNRLLQKKTSRGEAEVRQGPEKSKVFGLARKQSKNGKKGKGFGRKGQHHHAYPQRVDGAVSSMEDSFDV